MGVAQDFDDFFVDDRRLSRSLSMRDRSTIGLPGTSVAGSPVCDGDAAVPDSDGIWKCRGVEDGGPVDGVPDIIVANCSSAVSGGSPSDPFDAVAADFGTTGWPSFLNNMFSVRSFEPKAGAGGAEDPSVAGGEF